MNQNLLPLIGKSLKKFTDYVSSLIKMIILRWTQNMEYKKIKWYNFLEEYAEKK